jgi:tRNA 5-methylaminomethyl-2-thiouridine biosynthesis bifunctional protein
VLYTRLSHRHSALTDFSLQSYSYASRYYRQQFERGLLTQGVDGELCGNFQQVKDPDKLTKLSSALCAVPELAQILSAEQANSLLGIEQHQAGYWFPGSGWLNPPGLCHALLQHSRIAVLQRCGAVSLEQQGERWSASVAGKNIATADCVVVAAGTATCALAGLEWLPLQAIRGQTSDLPSSDQLSQLSACLCHDGYIAPSRQGLHTIGATFSVRDMELELRNEDHRYNLDTLSGALPSCSEELSALAPEALNGRVGFRCASIDYLPLIGPLPDRAAFLQRFGALRKNARSNIASAGDYMPGLYLNTGHGSRGLTSTPLAAELLASLICGEPLPLSRELYRAVAPARFLIRELSRKRSATAAGH